MQQSKKGSKLWENDSLRTSDFDQKKYSDLSNNNNNDDCNIGNNIDEEKHYLEGSYNDPIVGTIGMKEQSNSLGK